MPHKSCGRAAALVFIVAFKIIIHVAIIKTFSVRPSGERKRERETDFLRIVTRDKVTRNKLLCNIPIIGTY